MSDDFEMCDRVNENYQKCSVCTGDKTDNVWYVNGQCRLDQLTYDEVAYVLAKNPKSRGDLLRITNDPRLIRLANEVRPANQEQIDDQRAAKLINSNTLPFYNVLRGNLDGSIK